MKRLHVHVHVADLARSLRYYTTLFGADPTVVKPDYAKWMLEDPRVNFAISAQDRAPGLGHLGIQAEDRAELDGVAARLKAADVATLDQEATTCCYAKSDKAWSEDPDGIKWESFYTFGESTQYGEAEIGDGEKCCAPRAGNADAAAAGGACCTPVQRELSARTGARCCG
jgi:catechol 2,3-dioxygenase-like lactoylglutathione lyase family enzyme